MVDKTSSVVRLDKHIENHHTLNFGEGREVQEAGRTKANTNLVDWFEGNIKHVGAGHLHIGRL